MKAVALVVLLCSVTAFAQVSDVPLADIPGVSVKVEIGAVVPFTGRLLSEDENVRRAKSAVSDHAELAQLKAPENVTVSKGALSAVIAGSVVLTAIVTGLVVGFAKK